MEKLWTSLAQYYDKIYAWKDYHKEAGILRDIIHQQKLSYGSTLLDVGCGTGNHLYHLQESFTCTGVDQSRDMLHIANRKLPHLPFVRADMRELDLDQLFDVVICLYGTINYVKTLAELKKTINRFAAHTAQGGVLIIEPFALPEHYHAGEILASYVNEPNLKIARMNVTEREANNVILDFNYMIGTPHGVEVLKDKHTLLLVDAEKMLELLREKGFLAQYVPHGLQKNRGLFVAVKE